MLDKFFNRIGKIIPQKYCWILNHDGFKKYFANTGWLFFGQFFSLFISFFVGILVARRLGPDMEPGRQESSSRTAHLAVGGRVPSAVLEPVCSRILPASVQARP